MGPWRSILNDLCLSESNGRSERIGYILTNNSHTPLHPQCVFSSLCVELSPFIYKLLARQCPQMVPVDIHVLRSLICMRGSYTLMKGVLLLSITFFFFLEFLPAFLSLLSFCFLLIAKPHFLLGGRVTWGDQAVRQMC